MTEPVATLHIDVGRKVGPADHRGSGILYGLTEDGANPPDRYLTEMGFRFQRAGGAQLDSPGGWVAGRYERRWASALAQCRRTVALGGAFILLVHDLYGADGTTIDRWPGDGGDWSDFDAFLSRLLDDADTAGIDPQWDLWNEPDIDLFWPRPAEQFHEAWLRAYRAVRSRFPRATIVGPSAASEPSDDDPWWNGWLDSIARDGVVPDILSWHEIGGHAHGQDPVASRAAIERMLTNRGLAVQAFQVNEYAEAWQQYPGTSAWFLARLERAEVDGLRANWDSGADLHDGLAGLLASDNGTYSTLADWFTYRAYASQQGRMVASEGDGVVDVFATRADDDSVRLLIGNHGGLTGPIAINVRGLPSTVTDRDIHVERIPYSDGHPIDRTLSEPPLSIGLAGDSLSLMLNYASDRDAYLVVIAPDLRTKSR
jgi:hypothetical protein